MEVYIVLNKKTLFRIFMVFNIICFFIGTAPLHTMYGCIATTEFTGLNNVKKFKKLKKNIGFANESEFPATGFFNV